MAELFFSREDARQAKASRERIANGENTEAYDEAKRSLDSVPWGCPIPSHIPVDDLPVVNVSRYNKSREAINGI